MALAPIDEKVVGVFVEKSVGNYFCYSANTEDSSKEWPYKVWVTHPILGLDSGWRYAKVLKTVAYLMVDEDEYGDPVVEKWLIKNNKV